MPYWLFHRIFANANLDHFTEHGGVGCNLSQVYLSYVYHIHGGHLWPIDWNAVGGPFVEVKMVELSKNYMTDMTRYQIYQPVVRDMTRNQRREAAWSLVAMWRDVLTHGNARNFGI